MNLGFDENELVVQNGVSLQVPTRSGKHSLPRFVQTYFSGKWVGIELYCETEMACSETEVKQIQIKQLWRLFIFIYNSNIKLKLAEL